MKHFGPIVWLDEPPQRREWSDCGPDPLPAAPQCKCPTGSTCVDGGPRCTAPVVTVKTECRHRITEGYTGRPFPSPLTSAYWNQRLQRTPREQFIDSLKAFEEGVRRNYDFLHARNKLIELFDKRGK